MKDQLITLAISIDSNRVGIPRVTGNQDTVNSVVNGVFFIAAALVTLFIIINAFRYVISQGDSGRVSQAKDGILYSLAGLVIIAFSFAIVQVAIKVIQG